MLSSNLEITLRNAYQLATDNKHEFVTLEHLLNSLTNDKDAISVLKACGVEIEELKKNLEDFIKNDLANLKENFTGEPKLTNKDLVIDNKDLPKGTYSLWTIPRETSWDIIFNSEMNHWGVKFSDQTANRDPKDDVLVTTFIPSKSLTVTENFTISFSESNNNILMMLAWDTTVVPVLLQKK